MNPVFKLLWLSCLACTFACIVPSIDELEGKDATECNAEHPCPPEGFVCFENRCIRTEGLGCRPGDNKACGASGLGVCSQGTSQCNAKGEWGSCQATVAGTEVCDGQDNNCNGSTDEQLTQECAKTSGVCQGAVEPCAGGAYAGCTDATYFAHNPAYQRYETRCDGEDNDCDGRADGWDTIPLVAEHTSEILDAIAVKPTSSRGELDGVLTLTGESNGLVARTFTVEGILSTGAKFPAPASNVQFLSPALAEERDTVVAAWIEQTSTSATSYSYRVLMTLLDGRGNRIGSGPPLNVSPYNDGKTRPTRLWLAINTSHILLLIETRPDGLGRGEVWAVTVSRDFKFISPALKLGSPSGNWGPAATSNSTRTSFLVAYEDSSGVPKVGSIANEGTLSGTQQGPAVGSFAHSPFLLPAESGGGVTVYYVNWPDATSNTTTLMQVSCPLTTTAGCGTPKLLVDYFHHIQSMQMVARPGMRPPELALLRWENRDTGARGVSLATLNNGTVTRIFPPMTTLGRERTFSEVVALPSGGSPHLVYLQQVPGIGVPPQANLRPFCP